ncbi:hypothetical protein [Collinsella aerofaciens]|uniref:hypothetical protein n=1 Tax=Collinsella aerofaciens TaxID=74426 RepID=UPI001D035ABE|nr:hypothetical protein [Collinsella aerofaciens]MCB5366917.1 hypothetical protein [Collinsella aerofaciens]MCB5369021.1 hypothetical protein [Collinsella aerofaciens]
MPENFESALEGFQEKTPEQKEEELRKEQKKVIDRIIRGVNDTFIKDYNFEDLGLKFTIKIKAPNALEVGKIQARMAAYLGGMNNYVSEYMVIVYQTLATLREVGIDVPKELAKDEEIYNLDILYQIGVDFQEWLNSFRY